MWLSVTAYFKPADPGPWDADRTSVDAPRSRLAGRLWGLLSFVQYPRELNVNLVDSKGLYSAKFRAVRKLLGYSVRAPEKKQWLAGKRARSVSQRCATNLRHDRLVTAHLVAALEN